MNFVLRYLKRLGAGRSPWGKPRLRCGYWSSGLLICLLWASASDVRAAPRVEVVNAPDSWWEEKVSLDIQRVNKFLCDAFEESSNPVLVVRTHRSAEYDLSRRVIYIGRDYLPVELFHEYAHQILDDLLTSRIAAIGYFRLRQKVHGHSLLSTINRLYRELSYDSRLLDRLQAKSYVDMAANLSRYMQRSRRLLLEVESFAGQEPRFGSSYARFTGAATGLSLYRLISPYHELFADTLTVLLTRSWNAVLYAGTEQGGNRRGGLGIAAYGSGEQTAGLAESRAFKRGVVLDGYVFDPRASRSVYAQFYPTRSYIRKLAETAYADAPARLLRMLADSIAEEIELRLNEQDRYHLSLPAMNRQLIARMENEVMIAADRPGLLLGLRAGCSDS